MKCRDSYVLERMWRASETGCCDCPRPPTCGRPRDLYGAWRHWPRCCRTWLSDPPRSCFHHTPPQNSFCIHLNSASHSPRIVSRSVKQQRQDNFPEWIQESSLLSTRTSFLFLSHKTVLIAINLIIFPLWKVKTYDSDQLVFKIVFKCHCPFFR